MKVEMKCDYNMPTNRIVRTYFCTYRLLLVDKYTYREKQ